MAEGGAVKVERSRARGHVASYTLDDEADLVRPLAAVYKKNKVLSPAMKQFLGILKG